MEGTFRLARHVSGLGHWAEITVHVTSADRAEVVVREGAFAWLHRAYGPNATTQGPAFGEVKKEAVEGVRYALQALPAEAQPMRVLITEIHHTPVDTNEGDVKFAAAHAVWQALGHEPEHRPWVSENGVVIFPE